LKSIYVSLCPNCGGEITDEELVGRGVCSRCVLQDGRLKPGKYTKALELEEEYRAFADFFSRVVGSPPWSLQRTWAKRALLGRSFSIVSPTGTGKTTFFIAMAIYQASKGKKSYIIVPTSLLAQHIHERTLSMAAKHGEKAAKIAAYYSGMKKSEAEEMLQKIRDGEFGILVTTDRFLNTRFELLRGKKFFYIFVDDVDSFLKSPRNIDKVLLLMGFEEKEIERHLKLVSARSGESEAEEYASKEIARPDSVLLVAGATMKGRRTKRIRLFRRLLNFEPGGSIEFVRNISNMYLHQSKKMWEQVAELVKTHGGGCLIFVPQTAGVESAKELAKFLNSQRISAYAYEKMDTKMLKRFELGEYDVLVGIASTRSPLARGIDLPERIRYVIFAGVPRRELNVSWREHRPSMLLSLIQNLYSILREKNESELVQVMGMLKKCVPTDREVLESVREGLESSKQPEGFAGYVYSAVTRAHQLLKTCIGEEELRRVAENLDMKIRVDENGVSIILPDIDGYVQASGRSSRMFAGGITRGISILIVDDEKAFRGIMRALETIYEETFQEYSLEHAREEFKQCDRDRQFLREIRTGSASVESLDILRSSLIIVESPTKARTLAYFFGKPARRVVDGLTVYESVGEGYVACLTACQGHLVDITTSHGFHGVWIHDGEFVPMYVDIRRCSKCGEQFTDSEVCPNCGSDKYFSKLSIVDSLRKLALEFDHVFIATDPDTEGEKIGYDLYVSIWPFNKRIERLELHEITRKALRDAFKSPRSVSLPLVEAQVVRRIEDRWVGFELSRRLWEFFGEKHLSAGRVQTPVLGWIIQRMEEARKKKLVANMTFEDGSELMLENIEDVDMVKKLYAEGALNVEVADVKYVETVATAVKPYTTDSLLRDASIFLRMSAADAMDAAQTLFESGLITYHRTGATYVSSTGLSVARSYLEENFPGLFVARHHGEPGAHECIRPTKPLSRKQLELYLQSGLIRVPMRIGDRELMLYDLVFRRFMASQMKDALVRRQMCNLMVLGKTYRVERVVEVLEPGFLNLYQTIKTVKALEPGVHKVLNLQIKSVQAAPFFREGDIIALMRERGIGRPSTYAQVLNLLYKRRYIFNDGGRVLATKLGKTVYNYLVSNFGSFVSEALTRRLEELMESIESGKVSYQEVLNELYRETSQISKTSAKAA
jgi:reverse gyrase